VYIPPVTFSDSASDSGNRHGSRAVAIVAVTAVVAALWMVFAPGAFGQTLRAFPSDPRARFEPGNVSKCADAGFPNTIQFGSPNNSSVTGALLTGTVRDNAGPVQTGRGQELNITIHTAGTVVIDAVIVKGSDGYNVYSNPADLPPQLGPPQHYISPINNGGNVPDISHWFVCYHLATPPEAGSISLAKTVVAPNGVPVEDLPTSFRADVTCNSRSATVSFSAGGGSGTPSPALENLTAGTSCRVTEQDTASFPAGSVVSYSPSQTVTIGGSEGVTVTIINDFSGVAVRPGTVELHKVVDNPNGLPTPAQFSATVACNDGPDGAIGTDQTVTFGPTGGAGTPAAVHPRVGAVCTAFENPISEPPGWTVSYSVDGGPASAEPPEFPVESTTTINITITNTAPAPAPEGSLTVFKTVIPPNPPGVPVTPLPTSFTALVNCPADPAHHNVTVTFPASGGRGTPQLTGIPVGTTCTVVEQNRPANAVVTYFPEGANTTGVIIGEGAGVRVKINNDFSDAPLRTGTIKVEKVVHNSSGVPTPANFTAHVVCDDGLYGAVGTDVHVTLPGGGGAGSPVVHSKLGATCAVTESTRPGGWTATYAINGTSAGAGPASFRVTTNSPNVTVTITNDAPARQPSTTSPFVPGPGATGDAPPDHGTLWTLLSAAAALGVAATLIVRFRRGRGHHR
jgi:hypothetical protein